MPFRHDREAFVHRVDNLEDDVRRRDAEIGRLRRAIAATPEARWRRLAIGLGALALVLTLVAMRVVLRPIAEAAAGPVEVARWQPDQDGPLFADVDGDGQDELIGAYEGPDGAIWLGALSAEGAARWRVALPVERHHFTVTRDRVVIAGPRAVEIRRLADGEIVSRAGLPEPARELCVHHDRTGPVWIRGHHEHRLVHPDGRLEPSLRPRFCDPHQVTDPPRIGGVAADAALTDGHHVVAVGRDAHGALLTGFVIGDERVRWQAALPGAPLAPGRDLLLHPAGVVVARGETVVAYAPETGEERWRARLPRGGEVVRIVGGAERIALVRGRAVTVLDGAGRVVATFGR